MIKIRCIRKPTLFYSYCNKSVTYDDYWDVNRLMECFFTHSNLAGSIQTRRNYPMCKDCFDSPEFQLWLLGTVYE